MDVIDKPRDIRSGEELDIKKVNEFLRDSVPRLTGEITIKQFPSGNSNLTYCISIGNTELILRRPPFGKKAKSAHDMGREYRILKALKPVFPYCPEPLAYSEDESIMGCPFYVMERLHGIILRKEIPEGLEFTHDEMRKLCENYITLWADLHSIDYKKIGLENFGNPEGYVRRQVEGWSKRYRDAKTPDAPDFERVMIWLHEHMPDDSAAPAVIHNDFKLDNVVLNPEKPTQIIGLLDWEMATIGDPIMDLGSGLAYWVQNDDTDKLKMVRMHPTTADGALSREQLVQHYSRTTGRVIESFDYYYCFGLFRLAVIAQQIYYRYYHGQTKDQRFQFFIHGIRIFEDTALSLIS
ncbi:MAG: aminoglycoside phosphotransferase [Spirochaetes bacterium RBG_13_51_14]|nr:MAG: aminoglycoside phosphotransferase [Spirochaetes bacterium RBG_13_51_14]